MPTILEKKLLRKPDVFYFKVSAPLISKKAQPGQFVILRLHAKGERIPISLADINPAEGTISLIVMAVGKTTTEMSVMNQGDEILDARHGDPDVPELGSHGARERRFEGEGLLHEQVDLGRRVIGAPQREHGQPLLVDPAQLQLLRCDGASALPGQRQRAFP